MLTCHKLQLLDVLNLQRYKINADEAIRLQIVLDIDGSRRTCGLRAYGGMVTACRM